MTWLERAQEKKTELDAKFSRLAWLEDFIATADWGELESGAAIKAGDAVRFGALRYKARVDHSKALTRSPLNLIYWEAVIDA